MQGVKRLPVYIYLSLDEALLSPSYACNRNTRLKCLAPAHLDQIDHEQPAEDIWHVCASFAEHVFVTLDWSQMPVYMISSLILRTGQTETCAYARRQPEVARYSTQIGGSPDDGL